MAELEVASDDYRIVEKRYYKVSKLVIALIIIACAVGAVAFIIVPDKWLDQSVMILAHYCLITIILGIVLRYEIGIYFSYFTILRAKRNYEFNQVCSREIPLSIIFMICNSVSLGEHIYQAWKTAGLVSYESIFGICGMDEYQSTQQCNDLLGESVNFDAAFLSLELPTIRDRQIWYILLLVIESMCFIAFVFLNTPHDCFECLSIDKTIHISMFQFTREEKKLWKKYRKSGSLGETAFGVVRPSTEIAEDEDRIKELQVAA